MTQGLERRQGLYSGGHTSPSLGAGTEQSLFLQAPLLFNGCRSGEIFAIDLRCRNQGKGWKATHLFHDSAVTSVRILQEEQCLMASDMAGTVWVPLTLCSHCRWLWARWRGSTEETLLPDSGREGHLEPRQLCRAATLLPTVKLVLLMDSGSGI